MDDKSNDRSMKTIITEIIGDIPRLLTKEIELFRVELAEKAVQVGSAGVGIVVGLLLSAVALLILLQALVLALANVMPAWLAAVVVGGSIAIVGLIMVLKGQHDLKAANLMPRRTLNQLKEDTQMVKEKIS